MLFKQMLMFIVQALPQPVRQATDSVIIDVSPTRTPNATGKLLVSTYNSDTGKWTNVLRCQEIGTVSITLRSARYRIFVRIIMFQFTHRVASS